MLQINQLGTNKLLAWQCSFLRSIPAVAILSPSETLEINIWYEKDTEIVPSLGDHHAHHQQ